MNSQPMPEIRALERENGRIECDVNAAHKEKSDSGKRMPGG
jgi:hypothetical protein